MSSRDAVWTSVQNKQPSLHYINLGFKAEWVDQKPESGLDRENAPKDKKKEGQAAGRHNGSASVSRCVPISSILSGQVGLFNNVYYYIINIYYFLPVLDVLNG